MAIRLPISLGAMRIPPTTLFSFRRPFSTSDGDKPPSESFRSTNLSSTSGLENLNKYGNPGNPGHPSTRRGSNADIGMGRKYRERIFMSANLQQRVESMRDRYVSANLRKPDDRDRAFGPKDTDGDTERSDWNRASTFKTFNSNVDRLLKERNNDMAGINRQQSRIDFEMERSMSVDYLRQSPRHWFPGDVYSPRDLGAREMQKWRTVKPVKDDIVDFLGFRPQDMYKNFSLIQAFTTSSGQVRPRSQTGLRAVNQRKIAKMIRRAQGMGIYPTIHDHPELIRGDFYASERKV